jgi:hypothetical protein
MKYCDNGDFVYVMLGIKQGNIYEVLNRILRRGAQWQPLTSIFAAIIIVIDMCIYVGSLKSSNSIMAPMLFWKVS